MINITRFALVSMLLLGNVNAVSAVETVDFKDSIDAHEDELTNFFLCFGGGMIVGGLIYAAPEILNEKKRKFVKGKLKEYKNFFQNSRDIYLEILENIEEIQIETGYQNRPTRNSLEDFNHLLQVFKRRIDRVEFWYTELDFDCAKERVLEKTEVRNLNKVELIESNLIKGLYSEEELDLDSFKDRLEKLWQEIVGQYQAKPTLKKIEWLEEVWEVFSGRIAVDKKQWLIEALSTRREGEILEGCSQCENLIGDSWNGRRLVCARHPFGKGNCSDYRSIYQESEESSPSGCSGCENYHGREYEGNLLVCAIHPHGKENCADYR